ncbi:hypothetical protein SAMD00019534_125090 [Acytostelium subglobosum LB1]|uniref:hypothetical protein n=1 Tax=Acytostelium subglobosum LB1 TaxID=1410327 RepID=UPI000644D849|nr:hypothetical protein SAMD00019534_125090 [Acytostelium subglobosum LB1]GAM29333.1 hypothetical protein SAMD00019534_125090 [Acytostelium subglobosum LB1]|eukprot:XP_012747713.1 hypothetical protein SAMD00019534_125090 [Acytostelium subglobosum LB1]
MIDLATSGGSNNPTPSPSPSPPPPDEVAYVHSNINGNSFSMRSRSPSPSITPRVGANSIHLPPLILDNHSNQSLREEVVKVVCRFRPLCEEELQLEAMSERRITINEDGKTVCINNGGMFQGFKFSHVLQPTVTQEYVYQLVAAPLLDDVLNGYNAAIIAYGPHWSGKTYTMQGYTADDIMGPSSSKMTTEEAQRDDLWGLIPRVMRALLARSVDIDDHRHVHRIGVSYVEVSQERVRDLLSEERKADLDLRLVDQGFTVPDAIQVNVTRMEQVLELHKLANERSLDTKGHVLFLVTITREDLDTGSLTTSLFYMVDLSGSEAKSISDEAKSINQSLYALGGVIEDISKRAKHVRYRDSKLTQLLQNCLGGNSKTCLIVNCSSSNHESVVRDTVASLHFGERTQSVRNQPLINSEMTSQHMKIVIHSLKSEISGLKQVIDTAGGGGLTSSQISSHILRLQMQIEECRRNEGKLQEVVTALEEEAREREKTAMSMREMFQSKERDLARLEAERGRLQQQHSEAMAMLATRNNRISELEKAVHAVDEWKIRYSAVQELLTNNEQYVKTLENQKSKWKNKCDDLQTQISRLKDNSHNDSALSELAEQWRERCETLELKLQHYKEVENNLQSELCKLRDQLKHQTDMLGSLSSHMDELRQRMEIEFPAITNIVNSQTSTLESLSTSFASSSSASSPPLQAQQLPPPSHEPQNHLLLQTMRRMEDIFEKISEQQQEQSSSIQSFIQTFDQTTFTGKLLKELDADQQVQFHQLMSGAGGSDSGTSSSSNSGIGGNNPLSRSHSIPSLSASTESLFGPVSKPDTHSTIYLLCKNFITLMFVLLLVFIMMVCVGKTIQNDHHALRLNSLS